MIIGKKNAMYINHVRFTYEKERIHILNVFSKRLVSLRKIIYIFHKQKLKKESLSVNIFYTIENFKYGLF